MKYNETCSNLTQIAPANPGDTSHPTYHTKKRAADSKYSGRVKIVLSTHVGGINFVDPISMRKVHEEPMKQVRNKAKPISNKYKVQLEPFYFEWEMFIPTLEKEFHDIY